MQTRVYFSNLDSLRFFAFLAVFIAHAGILFPISTDWFYKLYRNLISHGSYGVNFFFILSGFLITYLLLLEKRKTKQVSIKMFYIKRVLRIWPLYYIVMLASVLFLPWFISWVQAGYIPGDMHTFPNLGMSLGEGATLWFSLFIGNFYRGFEIGAVPFALGVLWSVCVEEQFYLFWPWVVKKFSSAGVFAVSFFIFAISLVYKALHINDANIAYYSTVSVAMDLVAGCMMAVIYMHFERDIKSAHIFRKETYMAFFKFFKRKRKERKERRTTFAEDGIIFLAGASLLMAIYYCVHLFASLSPREQYGLLYDFARLMKRPFLDIVFMICILLAIVRSTQHKNDEVRKKRAEHFLQESLRDLPIESSTFLYNFRKKIRRWTEDFFSITTYLGKISYGLYGYHAVIMILVIAVFNHYGIGPNDVTLPVFLLFFIASFAGTVVLSHYSYQFLERRFLALKSRLK